MKIKISIAIISIISSLIFLELGLQAASWVYNSKLKATNIAQPTLTKDEIRILCEGDSTTAFGFNDSWPKKLEELLQKHFPQKKIHVINDGVPASVMRETLRDLPEKLEKYKPHFVITLLGVNEKFANLIDEESSDSFLYRLRLFKFIRSFKSITNKQQNEKKFIPHPANDNVLEPIGEQEFKFSSPSKSKLFQEALSHLRNQRYKEADSLLANLRKQYEKTDDPYIFLYSGICALRFNDIGKADLFFAKYLEIGGKNINFILNELGFWAEFTAFKDLSIPLKYSNLARKNDANNLFALRRSIILKESYLQTHIDSVKQEEALKLESEIENEAREYLKQRGQDRDPPLMLTYMLLRQKRYEDALAILEPFIIQHDDILEAHQSLITTYFNLGKLEDAYRELLKAKGQFPTSDSWITLYNEHCSKLTDHCSNRHYFETQKKAEDEAFPLLALRSSQEHYRKIVYKIQKANAVPIVMQYPRHSINQLKNLLDDLKPLYVNNEEPFESYLKTHPYEDLFHDRPGGNFGHGTPLTNGFIAENVFQVIKKYLIEQGIPYDSPNL